jgi:hypothetical protein
MFRAIKQGSPIAVCEKQNLFIQDLAQLHAMEGLIGGSMEFQVLSAVFTFS